MNEKDYYLAFTCLFEYIGPRRFRSLIEKYGTAAAAWTNLRLRDLRELGISEVAAAKCEHIKNSLDANTLNDNLSRLNVSLLGDFENVFPANLAILDGHPLALYVRGQLLPTDARAVAIVGTRRITSYGERVVEALVSGLVNAGVSIVSGLAFGVDASVAEETLKCGGRAIAVLASGVDRITPRSNDQLGQKIVASGGALVSELPLGTLPQNYYFPVRNRIISGLALGTVVIEAAEKSGSMHTANYCAEQGRPIMAVPGSIFSEVSQGTHNLIRDGATLVGSAADILRELNINEPLPRSSKNDGDTTSLNLSDQELQIFEVIIREETHIDELARRLALSSSEVSATLTMLELKGLVKPWGGGVYGR